MENHLSGEALIDEQLDDELKIGDELEADEIIHDINDAVMFSNSDFELNHELI